MPHNFNQAFITGGSSGIGKALAEALLKVGVGVTVSSRRGEGVQAGVRYWACDLSDEADLSVLEKQVAAANFDLVINAAGGGDCQAFTEITPQAARAAWTLMMEAPRRISVAALPNLLKNKGALVNISSMAADFPLPYMPLYNSSKAALSALTQGLIDEYPELQIIDLKPGDIKTGFAASWKIPAGKKWSATAEHLKKMIEEAPGVDAIVKPLLHALKTGCKGTLLLGEFFQTVIMPLGARLIPIDWVHAVRRAYLKRTTKITSN